MPESPMTAEKASSLPSISGMRWRRMIRLSTGSLEKVRTTLSYMPYAEIVFISAKTGQRTQKLFETIDMVLENQTLRIQTGVLNEILTEAMAMQQPPSDRGKRLKIYYMTQVSVKPPTFVIFVNDKELMHFSYTRYLENRIREAFGFKGTSLRFIIRERKEKEQ